MNFYFAMVSVVSIVVSAVLGRVITQQMRRAGQRRTNEKVDPLARSAILFAIVFVVLWWGVSCLLMIPWIVWNAR
ncbi:MAG: hypothetical protein ACOX1P_18710 [Thermoguttaceae bacterium]